LGGQRQFLPLAIAVRTYCHVERGDLVEAEQLIASYGYAGALDDTSIFNSHIGHARGLLQLAAGRVPAAIADLIDVGRRLDIGPYPAPSLLAWRSDLAVALAASGDHRRAMAFAGQELELAHTFGTARGIGIALRALGLAQPDHRMREQALRDAVATLTDSGAPVELARALVDLGSVIRRRGARAEARDPLTRGLDVASSCGAVAVAERARAELIAAGARPRRARLVGADSLTVTEARTAELAAVGSTNKQIAQAMFVTVKTVESHLAHAYQKLGIAGRAELAQALSPGTA
jgi:DNA-binding CsgD family transcriptional regulator